MIESAEHFWSEWAGAARVRMAEVTRGAENFIVVESQSDTQ